MKTYKIMVNTSKRFEDANYLKVGEVNANSKEEAKVFVEIARKFNTDTENVSWIINVECDLRTFIIK